MSDAKTKLRAPTPHQDYLRDLKTLRKAPADDVRPPALAELSVWQTCEVERMARQGLNLETIATLLGFDWEVWLAMIKLNPAINQAFRYGAARGADRVSGALLRNAVGGDPASVKYYLDRFGGPQFKPASQAPAVVVHTGPTLNINEADLAARIERQRSLNPHLLAARADAAVVEDDEEKPA
jgi:hypothetical protein